MTNKSYLPKVIGFLILALLATSGNAAKSNGKKLQVFILAGQSNMEGKEQNPLFDHQATDYKTKAMFAHLREDEQWVERDDVFMRVMGSRSPRRRCSD